MSEREKERIVVKKSIQRRGKVKDIISNKKPKVQVSNVIREADLVLAMYEAFAQRWLDKLEIQHRWVKYKGTASRKGAT